MLSCIGKHRCGLRLLWRSLCRLCPSAVAGWIGPRRRGSGESPMRLGPRGRPSSRRCRRANGRRWTGPACWTVAVWLRGKTRRSRWRLGARRSRCTPTLVRRSVYCVTADASAACCVRTASSTKGLRQLRSRCVGSLPTTNHSAVGIGSTRWRPCTRRPTGPTTPSGSWLSSVSALTSTRTSGRAVRSSSATCWRSWAASRRQKRPPRLALVRRPTCRDPLPTSSVGVSGSSWSVRRRQSMI